MRILIDATSLLLRSAGVKSYTWHWLRALRRTAPPGMIGAFPFLRKMVRSITNIRLLGPLATYSRLATLHGVNLGGSIVLDWMTRGADVFHASNQVRVAPWNCGLTATIHDMTCWLDAGSAHCGECDGR